MISRERASGFLKEQRLPIIITVLALLLAVSVGLVPVLNSENESAAVQQVDRQAELAVLDERLTALETAATDGGGTVGPALRAELDLIAKGLLNQTGRVSKLKKLTAPLAGDSLSMSPALRAELDLIAKGLLNQTGRVSKLKKLTAPLADGSLSMSPALRAELDLIAKGLLNQTSRVSKLKKNVSALMPLPEQLDRIDLQVINLSKAVGQLHLRFRAMTTQTPSTADELIDIRDQMTKIQDQVDDIRTSLAGTTERLDGSVAAGSDEKEPLLAIEAKLDQILRSISE